MAWQSFIPFLEPLINWGREASQRRHERKQAKHRQELAKVEAEGQARIKRIEAEARRDAKKLDAEIEYETTAMAATQQTWKDEVLIIWFLLVLTGYFLPWTQPYMESGMASMQATLPQWLQWIMGGGFAVSLGITQINRFAPLARK